MFAVGYTMDTIVFAWLENAVDIDKDVELPQFDLQYTTQRDCSQNYTAGMKTRRPDRPKVTRFLSLN